MSKGDNAVRVIRTARESSAAVTYVGFDLFENKDEFFERHPEDLATYDPPGDSYWEFKSQGHMYSAVRRKLSTVLPDAQFNLVAGDSTQTLPANRAEIRDATIVYVDGCHDYDVVSQDWNNIRPLFDDNRELIVVFEFQSVSCRVTRCETERETGAQSSRTDNKMAGVASCKARKGRKDRPHEWIAL